MKPFLGVVMALALLRVQGRKPNHGNCIDDFCVTVHTDVLDMNSAQKSCEDKGGHLMTVRTMQANSVVSDLLAGHTGNFWIGLRYTREMCSESSQDLKGYTWITGDQATNFTNWKTQDGLRVCAPRCVTVSKEDGGKWTERLCNHATEGYLCEYSNTNKCTRLTSESPVLYETPFGFARVDLQEVPNTSNATVQHLGSKHICFDGQWHKAPWSCEVYKGGCEHECNRSNDRFFCACFPGYQLESNALRCRRAHSDPCARANCSQACLVKGQGYVCACRHGFELGEDGKTCKDSQTCDDPSVCPDVNAQCVKTTGGHECRCKNGFTMENGACADDDECYSAPCEHTCNNTPGSYYCECSEGFMVSSEDRHKCKIYCADWECPAVACDLNLPYQCNCPRGFILEERMINKYVCTDINECEASVCDQNCRNTPGAYHCHCDEGFVLVGQTRCVKRKGLGTTSPTPLGTPPPMERASLSAGAILGIVACAVTLILLTVCIIHHNLKRCGKISTQKARGKDAHALQQVTAERYVKKRSIPNVHYN